MTDTEDFFAQFADELNDPKALSLEEVQRAMPVHGDTRESMIARNNRNNTKRLTNAELAAEAWRGEADLGIGQTNARFGYFKKPSEAQWEADLLLHSLGELTHRLEALTRFATLPHYDEQDRP